MEKYGGINMAGEKILVVDDEEHIQELIKFNLGEKWV